MNDIINLRGLTVTVIEPNEVNSAPSSCCVCPGAGFENRPQPYLRISSIPLNPEVVHEAAQTTKVALFQWPGMSPMLFRSLVGSPISEELLVRGCLLSFYQRCEVAPLRVGKVVFDGPNVMTSLAFALFHLANKGESVLELAAVWVISMFLGKAKRKTGGLLAPMFCHSVFNFVAQTMFRVATT